MREARLFFPRGTVHVVEVAGECRWSEVTEIPPLPDDGWTMLEGLTAIVYPVFLLRDSARFGLSEESVEAAWGSDAVSMIEYRQGPELVAWRVWSEARAQAS